jgi:choline transporter-like protein 2/4/5
MGCCGGETKEKGITEIKQKRWPTDCLFFILWVAMWGAIVVLYTQAVAAGGNPYKIMYGVDMNGSICGVDHPDKPYAAWPYPTEYEPKICVANCSETNDKDSEYMAVLYTSTAVGPYCIPNIFSSNDSAATQMAAASASDDSMFGKAMNSGSEVLARAVRDVMETQYLVLISGATCIFWVFFSIFVIRLLASYIVVIICFLILAAAGGGCYQLFMYSMDETNNLDDDMKLAVQIAGGVIGGIGVIFLLMLIFLRKQIQIAVEVVKEASRAIFDMPCLMFFPVFPALLGAAYMLFWLFVGFYVWSVTYLEEQPTPETVLVHHPAFFIEKAGCVASGSNIGPCAGITSMNTSNPVTMQRFVRNDQWLYASFFHFFHLLWQIQFLIYLGYLVFAGATCDWYFTKNKDANGHKIRGNDPDDLTKWPVLSSFWRTVKYHLGTVALCSLIIAIVQFTRAVIKYIEETTQGQPPNKVQKMVFACIQCCLKCLECCLDKLNRNALIWTAIWGDGFCTAACSAFGLLWRNLHRVAAITVVSTILLKVTTFIICCSNAAMGFAVINYSGMFDVYSPSAPCFVIFVMSYLVSMMFIEVFQAVIDTLFICFLVDLETNDAGEMLANETLQKLVGKYSEQSKELADKEQGKASRRPGHNNNKVAPVDKDCDTDNK